MFVFNQDFRYVCIYIYVLYVYIYICIYICGRTSTYTRMLGGTYVGGVKCGPLSKP